MISLVIAANIALVDPSGGYFVVPEGELGKRFVQADSVGKLGNLASLTHLNIRSPATETPSGLSQAVEVDSQFDCAARQVRGLSLRLISPANETLNTIPIQGDWIAIPIQMAPLFRLACEGSEGFELLAVDRATLIAEAVSR